MVPVRGARPEAAVPASPACLRRPPRRWTPRPPPTRPRPPRCRPTPPRTAAPAAATGRGAVGRSGSVLPGDARPGRLLAVRIAAAGRVTQPTDGRGFRPVRPGRVRAGAGAEPEQPRGHSGISGARFGRHHHRGLGERARWVAGWTSSRTPASTRWWCSAVAASCAAGAADMPCGRTRSPPVAGSTSPVSSRRQPPACGSTGRWCCNVRPGRSPPNTHRGCASAGEEDDTHFDGRIDSVRIWRVARPPDCDSVIWPVALALQTSPGSPGREVWDTRLIPP